MLPDINSSMDSQLLSRIEGKKRELDRLRPFPPSILRKLHEQFVVEWTYNSNAIEGNTLSLQETELVLSRGVTIGNKSLKEHFEAINHRKSIDFLESFVQKKHELSETFIKDLHRIILANIQDTQAGVYRTTNVRILGSVHIPPNPVKIPSMMTGLLEWYGANRYVLPLPELAAWIHYYFVCIHPFVDGNGRTARLLMNMILIQNGYPPAVILNVDRKKYYSVLKQADLEKSQNFLNFIGRSIDRSLMIYLNALQVSSGEHQGYISLQEATRYCSYSMEYLSLLARRGKLPAVKFNKNWMTTREAVESYAENMKARNIEGDK